MSTKKTATHTRTISPKLGILGIFGLLGFLGFLPVLLKVPEIFSAPIFFLFFAFFGFFGFFYEGKMSGTLIDERLQSNMYRAQYIANKLGLQLILLVSVISMSVLRLSTYTLLSLLIATIGLAFGLSIFLQSYLLYRFENEE